jgi:hypothetical protein
MTFYKKGDDNMMTIGANLQDYFLKIAPDLSVFDLVEQYYFNNNEDFGLVSPLFSYNIDPSSPFQSQFYRAMFFVKSNGDLVFSGLNIDETNSDYVVFPYKDGQVMIGANTTKLTITSTTAIDYIIGVGF